MKKWLMHNLKEFGVIFCAALLSAISVELLLLPAQTVVGGGLGVASILDLLLCDGSADRWYFSAGIWLLVVNVPILIYCYRRLTRRFAVKTTIYVALLSAMLLTFRLLGVADLVTVIMTNSPENFDKVLYVVLGGVLHGLSLPMMLAVNASTGGSDIVALIVQRHSRRSSSDAMRYILLANVIILVVASFNLYMSHDSAAEAVNMFIYSMAALFIGQIVQEYVFKGFSSAAELEITTDKPKEMVEALQSELKHGVTMVKVEGGYSHQEKILILCVVNKNQLTHARRIINRVDDQAFAYVENVKEVLGKGFANKEIQLDQNKDEQ